MSNIIRIAAATALALCAAFPLLAEEPAAPADSGPVPAPAAPADPASAPAAPKAALAPEVAGSAGATVGSGVFSITLGAGLPLFFYDPGTGASVPGLDHLNVGTSFSLGYQSFLTPDLALGGEVGGLITSAVDGRSYFAIPITAKLSYYLRALPFEFPLSLGLGMAWNKVGNDGKFDPVIKLGASAVWDATTDWSFGLNLHYWLIPQLYSSHPEWNRIGNFLEITLSANYRF